MSECIHKSHNVTVLSTGSVLKYPTAYGGDVYYTDASE